ncbi:hypothetical protein [Paraburkholderia sediminicola]|uniref:hypothetical protein n=1 Tax=Paraburkholderia sediminicola TaxID=458836 RepID=UPI0038BAEF07
MKTNQAEVKGNSGDERPSLSGRCKELSDTVKGVGIFIAGATLLSLFAPAALVPGTLSLIVKLFVSGLILRVLFVCMPKRELLHKVGAKIAEIYRLLATFQKLYVNACIVSAACFLTGWMGGQPFLRLSIMMVLAFWGAVVVYDVLRWYKVLSGHLVGKAVIGIAFVAASNLAYSLAGQQIASVVHVAPTNFTHTILFIALATIPVLLIFAGGMAFFACLFMSALVMLPVMLGKHVHHAVEWLLAGTLPKSDLQYAMVTRMFQVVFYGVVGSLLFTQGQRGMPWYDKEISHAATWLVFNFDMFEGAECKLGEGYKLAPLGDAKFLIAKRSPAGEINFEHPVKCDDLPAT